MEAKPTFFHHLSFTLRNQCRRMCGDNYHSIKIIKPHLNQLLIFLCVKFHSHLLHKISRSPRKRSHAANYKGYTIYKQLIHKHNISTKNVQLLPILNITINNQLLKTQYNHVSMQIYLKDR